jgi:hypothetical protein
MALPRTSCMPRAGTKSAQHDRMKAMLLTASLVAFAVPAPSCQGSGSTHATADSERQVRLRRSNWYAANELGRPSLRDRRPDAGRCRPQAAHPDLGHPGSQAARRRERRARHWHARASPSRICLSRRTTRYAATIRSGRGRSPRPIARDGLTQPEAGQFQRTQHSTRTSGPGARPLRRVGGRPVWPKNRERRPIGSGCFHDRVHGRGRPRPRKPGTFRGNFEVLFPDGLQLP